MLTTWFHEFPIRIPNFQIGSSKKQSKLLIGKLVKIGNSGLVIREFYVMSLYFEEKCAGGGVLTSSWISIEFAKTTLNS